MPIQKLSKALVTLGTLAVLLYVEIKSGSFGNNVFDQIQNHILSGLGSVMDKIGETVEVEGGSQILFLKKPKSSNLKKILYPFC